jgi:hypothetical protein
MVSRMCHRAAQAARAVLWGVTAPYLTTACGDESSPFDPQATECAVDGAIAVGEAVEGTLTFGDCVVGRITGAFPGPGQYEDSWTLTLTEPTAVVINVVYASSGLNMLLGLRDGSNVVRVQGTGNLPPPMGVDMLRIVETLEARKYTIAVRVWETGIATYTLSVAAAADCSPLGSLVPGVPVSGTLQPSDCPSEFGTVSDNWVLALAPDETIRIDLTSSDFVPVLALYEPRNLYRYTSGLSAFGDPRNHVRLYLAGQFLAGNDTPGNRTIAVAGARQSASGAYVLLAGVSASCGPDTTIGLGETVSGELTDADCFHGSGVTEDLWRLTLSSDTTFSVRMTSADFVPTIRLVYNDDGDYIQRTTDLGEPGTVELSSYGIAFEPLAAGTYKLIALSTALDARGAYQLTVEGSERRP